MVKQTQKIVAIIPARGGSKRIPHKNIIDFEGKPLITWTIEAAQKSNIFHKILVSTDCPEIAKISKDFGAEVPFLRDKYIDDHSPISQATIYALEQLKTNLNEEYDLVFQLMPNCPIRNSIDISNAYQNFINQDASFQISCFKFGWMNPWWAFKLEKNLNAHFIFKEAATKRSQDLENLYCPTGAIWIAKTKELKETGSFYTKKTIFYPLDWKSAVDIDNYKDLELAKAAYFLSNKKIG